MILGYLVVTSVLIVSLGRLGDMYGRVRIFNAGFAVYTVASLMLTVCWLKGSAGADFLIGFRVAPARLRLHRDPAVGGDLHERTQRSS